MNTKSWALMFVLCVLPAMGGEKDSAPDPKNMARLSGARLLVGYPPEILAVTAGKETSILEPVRLGGSVTYFSPSISRDGSVVAGFRWRDGSPNEIFLVATYSMAARKWTEYGKRADEGALAISADGSRLAFIQEEETKGEKNTVIIERVHILNLKTGEESLGPEAGPAPVNMSWSPDGKRLVYCHHREIVIWDMDTKEHRKIADGQMPAWSPNGEWIAYLNPLPPQYRIGWQECMVVHPDGTGGKTLVKLPRGWFIFGSRLFLQAPVWSPDSNTLLLNEMADGEKWTMNIDLLDLASLKLRRALKNTMPVFGWAEAK